MAVGIFPLPNSSSAVEKSGAIVHNKKIKPNIIPGKINPAHGFFILLRNICKKIVPINNKIIMPMATHMKPARIPADKKAIHFTPFSVLSIF